MHIFILFVYAQYSSVTIHGERTTEKYKIWTQHGFSTLVTTSTITSTILVLLLFSLISNITLNPQDNLRDILNEASHSTEQQNKSKTGTNNSNVLHHSGSTKTTAEVGQSLEEGFGRPQNKRARVLADMNYQLKTENGEQFYINIYITWTIEYHINMNYYQYHCVSVIINIDYYQY